MAVGICTNLFTVDLETKTLNLVEENRSRFPSLRELRDRISAHVYADGDKIYGYGEDLSELRRIGFKDVVKEISEVPKLTSRLILEGFSKRLSSLRYQVEWRRFITQAFDDNRPIMLSIPEIRLLKGCVYRPVT